MSKHASEQWIASPGLEISDAALETFAKTCIANSEYELVSGGHGTSYLDIDSLLGVDGTTRHNLAEIVEASVTKVRQLMASDGYDVLAFVEGKRGPVGAVSLRAVLALELDVQTIVIRPDKRLLSQAVKPFVDLSHSRVLIITDVATTGRSVTDAATILWELNSRHCGALAIADRREGAEEFLETLSIPLHQVVLPKHPQTV